MADLDTLGSLMQSAIVDALCPLSTLRAPSFVCDNGEGLAS